MLVALTNARLHNLFNGTMLQEISAAFAILSRPLPKISVANFTFGFVTMLLSVAATSLTEVSHAGASCDLTWFL